jgi:hypothetical protein
MKNDLPLSSGLIVHVRDLAISRPELLVGDDGPSPLCARPWMEDWRLCLVFLVLASWERMILGPRISTTISDPSIYETARKPVSQ